MRVTTAIFLPLLCAAAMLAPLEAQTQTAVPDFSDRVDINEVLLDVLVTDKEGNVIIGLDASDFVVEEEGEIVELTGSTFYSNRELVESAHAADSGISADEVPEDRYFIFFLHDQRRAVPQLTSRYLDLARRTEHWIRNELLANDWVAVVGYDVKLEVYSDFTRDNEKLVRAVNDLARGKSPQNQWPSRAEQPGDGPSLLANLPTGKDLRKQTTRLYSGLEVLAGAAGSVVGRKNLLFFSAGFGEETGIGTILPDPRYYDDTVEALNDSNIAVYSISSLKGLDFAGRGISNARALQNSLSVLANDTGGRSFFNHVSFDAPLARVLEENGGYYLLSYRSETPAGESGYRRVAVKAKNPNFKVTAREGYRFGA